MDSLEADAKFIVDRILKIWKTYDFALKPVVVANVPVEPQVASESVAEEHSADSNEEEEELAEGDVQEDATADSDDVDGENQDETAPDDAEENQPEEDENNDTEESQDVEAPEEENIDAEQRQSVISQNESEAQQQDAEPIQDEEAIQETEEQTAQEDEKPQEEEEEKSLEEPDNENYAIRPDGSWNFHTIQNMVDLDKCLVEFQTTFYQPRKVQPVPKANANVWFTVTKNNRETWKITSRFEHHHMQHTIERTGRDPRFCIDEKTFLNEMRQQSRLLAAPCRRAIEIIQSKEQQSNHPATLKLFLKERSEPESVKGGAGIIPKDKSYYKATFEDAQKIMSRSALDASALAKIPFPDKVWNEKGPLQSMSRNDIFKELENYRT